MAAELGNVNNEIYELPSIFSIQKKIKLIRREINLLVDVYIFTNVQENLIRNRLIEYKNEVKLSTNVNHQLKLELIRLENQAQKDKKIILTSSMLQGKVTKIREKLRSENLIIKREDFVPVKQREGYRTTN